MRALGSESAKRSPGDLAIFGGGPIFQEPVYVGQPNVGNRESLLTSLNSILDRRWLTNNGRYVQEFEHTIADLVGVKHCIATCSGTMALELAVRALDLSGEVLVPSFTFVATAHALKWQYIKPVFCDIDPSTYMIDPFEVEKKITSHTTGIIGVHLWGRACNVKRLEHVAAKHGLKLLFDASHAFNCTYQGKKIGGFGNAEVFSFHATKIVNTFEGGAIVTDDDTLAEKLRLMKNFGFNAMDGVSCLGTNGKMSEMSAAMGLSCLEDLDKFVEQNRRNNERYAMELHDVPGIKILDFNKAEQTNYHYAVAEVDDSVTGISRDNIIRVLHAENIIARRYFYPGCHNMEPYRSDSPHNKYSLQNTEQVVQKVLVLPMGGCLATEGVSQICHVIRFIVSNGKEISEFISSTMNAELKQTAPPSFFNASST